MRKRIVLLISPFSFALLLSGCNEINHQMAPESSGLWNVYVVNPLSWLIVKCAQLLGGEFGLSIIVVTLLIWFAILPLMLKQTRNSKAMQQLQPEIKKLKETYSSRDPKTQQRLQQETMAVFQQHGVNPMAGCLPLMIQMPILIGFYQAISRTAAIAGQNFLWFDLGSPDPLYILPLLAGATTFIQQKMMMGGSENQNPQMALMQWMMPVMIVIFAFGFPAALSLYWVVGNLFMIVQTYYIKGPELNIASATGDAGGAKK